MSITTTHTYSVIRSPVGELLVAANDEGITHVLFERANGRHNIGSDWRLDDGSGSRWLATARSQLAEYFAGERLAFDLPLAAAGTPFQRSVWSALSAIEYGEVISYGELARRIGNPRAVRAVGLANGRNPISIVVPCHRVIGANGTLTGYGGGLERKRWLLALEASKSAR